MALVDRTSTYEFGVEVGRDTIQSIAGITEFISLHCLLVDYPVSAVSITLSGERRVNVEVSVPVNYQVVFPNLAQSVVHVTFNPRQDKLILGLGLGQNF